MSNIFENDEDLDDVFGAPAPSPQAPQTTSQTRTVGFGKVRNEDDKRRQKEREKEEKQRMIDEEVKKDLAVFNEKFGYVPLGIQGLENYIYSKYRKSMVVVSASDFTLKTMVNILGKRFLDYKYRLDFNSYDLLALQEAMTEECIDMGNYDIDNIKGYGIFVDPLSKRDLIVNGENIWGTASDFTGSRIRGRSIFNNEKDLKLSKEQAVLTSKDVCRMIDLLKTFNYTRQDNDQDLKLLFGWIIVAPFSGCLKWRTHGSLTGVRGSGKSTLQEIIKNILGEFSTLLDGGSSEAGIRQLMGASSGALLLDESEADGVRLGQILGMLRSASSGARKAMGTSDQKGNVFELRMSALLSGIVPPQLNGADQSRFVRIELLKRDETKRNKDLIDIDFQNEFGKSMIMTLIKNYSVFSDVLNKVRMSMLNTGNDSRYADTYGALIAASFMFINLIKADGSINTYTDKSVEDYLVEFNFDNEKSQSMFRDEEELLKIIFTTEIKNDNLKSETIVNFILKQENSYHKTKIKSLLGSYGIKVISERDVLKVLIDCSDFRLKALLKGTRFAAGDLKTVLKRVDGYEEVREEISIGSVRRTRGNLVKIRVDVDKYKIEKGDDRNEIEEVIVNNVKKVQENIYQESSEEDWGKGQDVDDDIFPKDDNC